MFILGNFCEVKIIISQERESMHSKLSDHKFNKGVFKSGFSQLMTTLGKEEDWAHSKISRIYLVSLNFK